MGKLDDRGAYPNALALNDIVYLRKLAGLANEDGYVTLSQILTLLNPSVDHGTMGGLGDDDHPHYLLVDGTRNVTGNLTVEGQSSSNGAGTIAPLAATAIVDWDNGNSITIDMGSATGDITLTLNNPLVGASYLINFIQGSTYRDVILPSNVLIPNGSAPNTLNITEVDTAVDTLTLFYDGTNYIAQLAQNFG